MKIDKIAASIVCLGLSYFCFEYDSTIAGIGAFVAVLYIVDF